MTSDYMVFMQHQSSMTQHTAPHTRTHITFDHLADAVIHSDLQEVQGHSLEASRVKCLAQEHNVVSHGWESNRQPSD